MNRVTIWAILVLFFLLILNMIEGYIVKPTPMIDLIIPSNIQGTITGDKKYIHM